MTSFDNNSPPKKGKKEIVVIGVRFSRAEADQLSKLAKADGRTRAGLLHKLAMDYLKAAEV